MKIECCKCNNIFNDKKIILCDTGNENFNGQRVFMSYLCKKCFNKRSKK
jgi:hypothetical protein